MRYTGVYGFLSGLIIALLADGHVPGPSASSSPDSLEAGETISLEVVGAPMIVTNNDGEVLGASRQARGLLAKFGIPLKRLERRLPARLWADLSIAGLGEAIEWQPDGSAPGAWLGCTRYSLGTNQSLVLMREVSEKRAELHRRLHRQRLESTGRLVATIAHDVRTSVASILYNSDWMAASVAALSPDELAETAREIQTASRRLQAIVDRLLDFAKLGPPVTDDISLADVAHRVVALVRPVYRDAGHSIRIDIGESAAAVRGNALVLDQILLNLLVNAAEVAKDPLSVCISTEPAMISGAPPVPAVRILVEDDGPGVPEGFQDRIFEPFFTTRQKGTGLGLTTAREAARELGGELELEPSPRGARFVVTLPAGTLRKDRR